MSLAVDAPRMGQRLVCPVCGAEITVVHGGRGSLAPRCCNQPMRPVVQKRPIWHCPICRRQILVARDGGGDLTLRCCNAEMIRVA